MNGLTNRHYILGGVVVAAVALTLFVLLQRCGGLSGCDAQALPRGAVTFDQVERHPEGHLFYPGAHVLWPVGSGERPDAVEGLANPAFAGAILTSNASADEIYRWYREWMLSHGWQPDRQIGLTVWVSHVDFRRGSRELFTVAVDNPQLLSGVLGRQVPTDEGTVFEISYQILPTSTS
jgi:hypothetical protein